MSVHEEFVARIRGEGFSCDPRPDADFLNSFTASHLFHCAELRLDSRGKALACGVSFSVQFGRGLAFLGMPNGVIYQIFEPVDITALSLGILKGDVVPLGAAPYSLPHEFIAKNRMRAAWPIECVKSGVGGWNTRLSQITMPQRPFTEAEFVSLMATKSIAVGQDDAGFIHTVLGSAEALTRFDSGPSQRILIYDGFNHSNDHIALLRSLCEIPSTWVFEVGWGTRIDANDPYYSSVWGTGPKEPMSLRMGK